MAVNLDFGFHVDVLDLTMGVGSDLEFAVLDVACDSVKTRLDFTGLPGRQTRVKDVVHLLQGLALRLWCGQKHVDESNGIEGTEDHIHLPVDGPQKRWDGEGKNTVPGPVGSSGETDGLRADLGGKDLRRVCPGNRSPGSRKSSDKEV